MQQKILHSKFYAETYNEADIEMLCNIGELAPSDRHKFRADLEEIAAIYRWENSKHENLSSSSKTRQELQLVAKHATRLLAALEGLSWEAQSKIDSCASSDSCKMITGEISENDHPSLAISLAEFEGNATNLIIDVPELRSLVGGLIEASNTSCIDLPKGRPGKNRSWGLRLWMVNIEQLWRQISNKPFTRDTTSQNDPITNAARFCVAALQIINPECPSSLIMTEMKAVIKNVNRRTG